MDKIEVVDGSDGRALTFRGRCSVDHDDPGRFAYDALRADGYDVDVFLDGSKQGPCITADPVAGWIKRHAYDENGKLKISEDGEVFVTEEVKGVVEIRLRRRVRG